MADLLDSFCLQFPALEQELADAPPLVFVGDEEATVNTSLTEGSSVHLVWALAGG